MIFGFNSNDSVIFSGKARKAPTTLPLNLGLRFLAFAKDKVSNIKAVSCVVKALVEATPISGPALVSKTKSDSLASELVGTLQMVSEPK